MMHLYMKNQAFKINLAGQTYKIRNTLAPYTLSITHNYFVESVTVIRESSKFPGAHLGEISNNDTVYLGDELTISATAVDGCTLADYITQITVKGNVKVNIQANPPATYLLGISYSTGVESVTVIRESSSYTKVPIGKITNGTAIYPGDVLSIAATASNGYKLLDYVSSITVSDNVNVSVEARELETYELNVSWGAGVQNIAVTRVATRYPGATLDKLTNGATIYEDDILLVNASAVDGYTLAEYESNYTVSDNLDICITVQDEPEASSVYQQRIVLADGSEIASQCAYESYDVNLSADLNLCPIWSDPTYPNRHYYWESSVTLDHVTLDPDFENGAPLAFYKCNFTTTDDGYITDSEFVAAYDYMSKADVVLRRGTYVGSIWVERILRENGHDGFVWRIADLSSRV